MILVTGAAGFIGSHLCEKLIAFGQHVVGIDNLDPFYDPAIKQNNINRLKKLGHFDIVPFGIENDNTWGFIDMKFPKPKAIVHLAALAGVRPSIDRPIDYYNTNVIGTIRVLEYARNKSIQKIVAASSSSVYGNSPNLPFSEEQLNLNPISPYGCSKLACEQIAINYASLHKLNITMLRYFTVYGPRQRPDLAIHKFTKAALLGEPVPFYGDGSTGRDYTYIDDVVDATVKAIFDVKHNGFQVFNIGNSNPVSLKDMVATIENLTGTRIKKQKDVVHRADALQTYANISLAEKYLGWKPKISFDDGMRNFVEWAKGEYQ